MQVPLNLMVVEDNDIDVEILRRAMRAQGMLADMVHARDGQEALKLLATQVEQRCVVAHPFLILLDINMPGMNGHEFLDQLRGTPAISDARVVVLTTSDNVRDIARAYRNHVAGYLVKPRSSKELQVLLLALQGYWSAIAHLPRPEPDPIAP